MRFMKRHKSMITCTVMTRICIKTIAKSIFTHKNACFHCILCCWPCCYHLDSQLDPVCEELARTSATFHHPMKGNAHEPYNIFTCPCINGEYDSLYIDEETLYLIHLLNHLHHPLLYDLGTGRVEVNLHGMWQELLRYNTIHDPPWRSF